MDKQLIQIISENRNNITGIGIVNTSLSSPISLDSFEITIVDLRSGIWYSKERTPNTVDVSDDLVNLSTMIKHSSNTKVIIIYPQSVSLRYDQGRNNGHYVYNKSIELKNMLTVLTKEILNRYLNVPAVQLRYESTETKINDHIINADFYFNISDGILTKSNLSNKPTTVMFEDKYFTTLNITTFEELISFLTQIDLICSSEDEPEWMELVNRFDDIQQKQIISNNNDIINRAQEEIKEAEIILEKNKEYKSILYTNGDELVRVVFKILEEMLDYDLSNFKDIKNEDFIIQLEVITFIGEIKGVTTNVKSEHISQVDVHLQSYTDAMIEDGRSENLKPILIITHQRKKELSARENVHEKQITLAKRNGCLIIETNVLLDIYESFINEKINREQIIEFLKTEIGLADYKTK